MNYTMNTNYMANIYKSLAADYMAKIQKQTETEKNFAQNVKENSTQKTASTKAASQDMSMAEYMQYIYDRLSRLYLHPSRMQESISVHISDAGFEAMKNDPEYEEWVINHLQEDFKCSNPWTAICGGSYSVHYIGASKEEYRGIGWYAGYQNGKGESLYNEKSKGSFWERKAKHAMTDKKYKKKLEQEAREKKLRKKELQDEWIEEKLEQSRMMQTWRDEKRISQAFDSYDANILLIDSTELTV